MSTDRGGVRGLVEPVLHSGGRGVLPEYGCPPDMLAEHCALALERIRSVAGPAHTPHGYYAFCDADLESLAPAPDSVYAAIESTGLSYVVSSARPGRNRILRRTDGCVVVTLDAPVVAFGPYIWRHGSRFMRIVDWFTAPGPMGERRNVLPTTVARYARILKDGGWLPSPRSSAVPNRHACS